MKNSTVAATCTTDILANIFDDAWELQKFPIPKLTPGFKLEPPFSREFPAFLGRASPLPEESFSCVFYICHSANVPGVQPCPSAPILPRFRE
ncbi:MAG: hypothetical protein LBB26_01755 [Puniceicoccales bacterium]|jgi:hypothetical protein|nr:hypothetical protein [Puniceicoccales bacterium]